MFCDLTVTLGRPAAIIGAIILSQKSKYVYLSKYLCVMYIVVVDFSVSTMHVYVGKRVVAYIIRY